MLGGEIQGMPVETVMISQVADIEQELYIGITIDGYAGKPVIVASTNGGVNIEKTAAESPDKLASMSVDPAARLYPYMARTCCES